MAIFIIDVVSWMIIHFAGAYVSVRLSANFLNCFQWLYRTSDLELAIYRKLRIKRWVHAAPDSGDWVKGGVKKSKINIKNQEGIRLFLLETRRAEISHWLQLLPSPIFFAFNDVWAGCIMIVYALCFNLPLIAIQRFNRNRLLRISARYTRQAQ